MDDVIRTVQHAVTLATPGAPLRLYALGIGTAVSTAVVEGIARAGNGECYFAVKSEAIIGKCSKLLRAGRSSFVEDISIDWGIPEVPQSGATSTRVPFSVTFSDSIRVQLPPPPVVQQTPHKITKIFPGTRFVVFALTSQGTIPKEVILRGRLNDGGERVEIRVPVSSVRPFDEKSHEIPLVHTLAARRLITDLVEDRVPLPIAAHPATSAENIRRAAVVRLGVEYQLASKYTSFVAVDNATETLRRGTRDRHQRSTTVPPQDDQTVDTSGETFAETALTFVLGTISSLFASTLKIFEGDLVRGRQKTRTTPGAYSSPSVSPAPGFIHEDHETDYDSTDTHSTMSSLESSSSDSSLDWDPPVSAEDAARMRSHSPVFGTDVSARTRRRHDGKSPQSPSSTLPPVSVPVEVFSLVELQNFNGRFALDGRLGAVVGQSALSKPDDVQVDDTLWATALAVAYLRKHLAHASQGDLLNGLLDKVMESIGETTRDMFESLVTRAVGLVV